MIDNPQTDRRARYAAAIRENAGWVLDDGQHMIDAVMAVADAERVEARATVLREAADRVDGTREDFPIAVQNGITWATAELRRMADEAQQQECDHDSQVIDHQGAQYWACLKCGTNLGRVDEVQQQPVPGPGRVADEEQGETERLEPPARNFAAYQAAIARVALVLREAREHREQTDPSEQQDCVMCGADHLAEIRDAIKGKQPTTEA